jgi:hypothetical protein
MGMIINVSSLSCIVLLLLLFFTEIKGEKHWILALEREREGGRGTFAWASQTLVSLSREHAYAMLFGIVKSSHTY